MTPSRRRFLEIVVGMGAAALARAQARPLFEISLAQWSLHRGFFGDQPRDPDVFRKALRADPGSVLQGELDPLDFAVMTRQRFDIDAVEYVNTFYLGRLRDRAYLGELKKRADGEGVRSLPMMCDNLGHLGDPDRTARRQAIENHRPWLEWSSFLGCHSIRVNARSEGAPDEQMRLAADGLRRLGELGDAFGLNVLVENHGGLSSNGKWLAGVMKLTDHPRVGTLPDFGNFRVSEQEHYDYYRGVAELMPFAKAVSAKSYDFDQNGEHHHPFDFRRLMKIVLDAGYRGYVGIEYEGSRLGEAEGIAATKVLLVRLRDEFAVCLD